MSSPITECSNLINSEDRAYVVSELGWMQCIPGAMFGHPLKNGLSCLLLQLLSEMDVENDNLSQLPRVYPVDRRFVFSSQSFTETFFSLELATVEQI
jgi:hypothetical protein